MECYATPLDEEESPIDEYVIFKEVMLSKDTTFFHIEYDHLFDFNSLPLIHNQDTGGRYKNALTLLYFQYVFCRPGVL